MAPHGGIVGQRCGQGVEPVAVDEAGVGGAGGERLVAEDADQQVPVGGDPVDPGSGQGRRQGERVASDRVGPWTITLASIGS